MSKKFDVPLKGDIDNDGKVNYSDLFGFINGWLNSGYTIQSIQPVRSPLVRYKFDETSGTIAADSSGAYNGIVAGGTSWVPAGGHDDGGCLSINGVAAAVTVPAALFNRSWGSGITFSVWVKGASDLPKSPAGAVFAGYDGSGNWNERQISFECPSKIGSVFFAAGRDANFGVDRVEWKDCGSQDWQGSWTHYVCVKDVALHVMRIYRNGALVAEQADTMAAISNIGAFWIGGNSQWGWSGKVDDFRIYDYALTGAEITGLAGVGSNFHQPAFTPANISGDGTVNLQDFAGLGDNWQEQKDKTILMVEVDEGYPDQLMAVYKNDYAQMDLRLQNVYDSLSELTDVYEVIAHFYPTAVYDPCAYGIANPAPIDRVHPALRHVFEFFQRRGRAENPVKIYLEMYSSGIHMTPLTRLVNTGSDPGRDMLAMDIDAVAALKDAYPETFAGIRFHEQSLLDIDEEVVKGFSQLCRDKGIKLIWSHSAWLMRSAQSPYPGPSWAHFVYDSSIKPSIDSDRGVRLTGYAEGQLLGEVCFNSANNNYHTTANLDFMDSVVGPSQAGVVRPLPDWLYFLMPYDHNPLRDKQYANWGLSIQTWFWHELTYTVNRKYYLLGDNSCPAEVMGTYIMKGLHEGAEVLQFEPPWYFFNMDRGTYYPATSYEVSPDYSERLAFKRIKHILLNPDDPNNPSYELGKYFDRDQQRFFENDSSNPPLNYTQGTLGILLNSGDKRYYDSYCDGTRWRRSDENRYLDSVFDGNVLDVMRIELLQGDGIDELMVLKQNGSGRLIQFYTQDSSPAGSDTTIANDNQDGAFVGMTAANLISEPNNETDADEIVVARKPATGTKVNLRVYKKTWISNTWAFSPLSDSANQVVLQQYVDDAMLNVNTFKSIVSIRKPILYTDFSRAVDILAMLHNESGAAVLRQKGGSAITIPSFAPDSKFKTIDFDTDREDELCFVNNSSIGIFKLNGTNAAWVSGQALNIAAGQSVQAIFSHRKTILVGAVQN